MIKKYKCYCAECGQWFWSDNLFKKFCPKCMFGVNDKGKYE